MSFLEWFLSSVLFVIYVTCVFTIAGTTFAKGRWLMGILGIFMPVFWIIGSVLPAKNVIVE